MPNVAFESYGYPRQAGNTGAINSEVGATFWPRVGKARFSVVGEDDFKASPLNGIDRGIRIEAGTAVGDAVLDHLPVYDTFQFPQPAGTSQWFLLVIRRNWSAPAVTTLFAIPGGTDKGIKPLISNTPGVQSDQPLWWVRVAAGNTVVQELVDMRAWGGSEAATLDALTYLEEPGATYRINENVWRYERQGGDVWGFTPYPLHDTGYFRPIFFGNGFKEYYGNGYDGVVCRVLNGVMYVSGAVRNDNPAGWSTDKAMFRLEGAHIPHHKRKGVDVVADISGNFFPVVSGKLNDTVSFSVSYPLDS